MTAETKPMPDAQCYCGHDYQDHQAQGYAGTECYAPQLQSGERCDCTNFSYWPIEIIEA